MWVLVLARITPKLSLQSCLPSIANITLGICYTCVVLCCNVHGCCAVECSVACCAAQRLAIATLTVSTLYLSSLSTIMGGGGSTPCPPGLYLKSKEIWKTRCNPRSFSVRARCTATGPTKATTANGPTNREWNFLVPTRGKFLLESRT